VIAYESGVADTVDPLAGSYFVEYLTDRLQEAAESLLAEIEAMGGAVAAIEGGWMQARIEDSAYREARRQADGSSVVVGVNRFASDEEGTIPVLEVDPALEEDQRRRLAGWRAGRDQAPIEKALSELGRVAGTKENLMPAMKAALQAGATVGEVSDRLRSVFGVYKPG
jgi:methylmalonyl-CoA mutase N-terminal domain/subunit